MNENPDEKEVIWPVVNASDLTSNAGVKHSRYIINFTGMSKEGASKFKNCYNHIEQNVLPHRQKQKRKANRENWWLYNEARPGLYNAIKDIDLVLVNPVVSKYISFDFLPSHTVFTNALNVYCLSEMQSFSILQSQSHEFWALRYASSLRIDPRYNPTDCFETFPFPENWEENEALESIGQIYYDYRAELMIRNDEGLTKTYNRFHDRNETSPEIHKLRDLHTEMDQAVLAAYGWQDIATDCEFIPDFYEEDKEGNEVPKNLRYRWPDEVRDEVLARLLALNAERAKQEQLDGTAAKKAAKKSPKKRAKKKATTKTAPKKTAPKIIEISEPTETEIAAHDDLFGFTPPKKQVAKKNTTERKDSGGYQPAFARRVLAAEILIHCYAEPKMGRVKLQKLMHLTEYHAKVQDIHGNYERKAAGPFDHRMMFSLVSGLKKQKWFDAKSEDKRTTYKPLAELHKQSKYFKNLKADQGKVKFIITEFKEASTQQCEIVSTLYAAWNDLIIENATITDALIIKQASTKEYWHENKEDIDKEKWPIALQWMKDKGIIPEGWGASTKKL